MFIISDSVHIDAPIERCFLLSTNIEVVAATLRMRPIEGKTEGMITHGDRLVWGGWKFGLPQMHESLITEFEPPVFFQDTMGRGRFKKFQHDHHLTEIDGHTLLSDKLRFSLPFGWAGKLVARHLIVPYICRLLRRRMMLLKEIAEGEGWQHYLPEDEGQADSNQILGNKAQFAD